MKKHFFFVCILCCMLPCICIAQSYKFIYYFDDHLDHSNANKATIIAKGFIEKAGLFQLDYFSKKDNFLFMSAHFTDSSLNVMQGPFKEFSQNGKVKKQGNYFQDQKEGGWQTYDSSGLRTDSVFYKNDKRLSFASFSFFKNGNLSYASFTDSLADTLKTISYNDKQERVGEVFFKGNNGISKRYDAGNTITDVLTTREEREAEFPGGAAGWINYLIGHLNASVPVDKGAPKGKYQVMIKFIVSKEGKLSDVIAETNHGYGMEKEVIRIIKAGPAWIPAIQYGRKVNAYRRQPVTFAVDEK